MCVLNLANKEVFLMGYDRFLKNKKFIDINNLFGKDSINISSQIDSTKSNGSKINYIANFTINSNKVIFYNSFKIIYISFIYKEPQNTTIIIKETDEHQLRYFESNRKSALKVKNRIINDGMNFS